MATISETSLLNVVIVDDEIDACRNLQKILVEYVDPGIKVLGVAHNTADAQKLIGELKPNVVFLDIEMPHENAFSFLDRISPFHFEVTFVTAYDEYAIKAFKLNAVDYILKPICLDEVTASVKKAKERITFKNIVKGYSPYGPIYSDLNNYTRLDKIRLKDSNGFDIVDFKDILYVEAKGSYSSVWFQKEAKTEKNIITTNTLNEYEELFPENLFCRIHRSFLVNCMHVKSISANDNAVTMKNNIKLPVSRRRITDLMEFFKQKYRQ